MNRKIFTGAVVVIAALIIFTVVTVRLFPAQDPVETPPAEPLQTESPVLEESTAAPGVAQTHTEEADAIASKLGKMGEPYTLHSRYYKQGEAQDESALNLGWNGDMTVVLKSAKVTAYASDRYLDGDLLSDNMNSIAESFENPAILQLELSLTNLDAENANGIRYQFDAGIFHLSGYEDLIAENWAHQDTAPYSSIGERFANGYFPYFDHHGTEEDTYYLFELNPGETLDFTLEYLIDMAYLDQDTPFLAISPGSQAEAGILFDRLEK